MIKTLFLDHPGAVDETYSQHFRFAMSFAGLLFLASAAAFVHALIPALCQTTASRILNRLNQKIATRH